MNAIVQMQNTSMALVPQSMGEAMELAEFMSKASLIPAHLQGKPGDCLLVVMQAQRWGMDAMSVAQCTSVVRGKLCYEGKLVSAVLMTMGALKDDLDYEFSGSGQNRRVVVTGTLARSGKTKTVEGTVAQWKTSNEAWNRDPDQMLAYRGARQWARRHSPSSMMGVYTPDEMEDVTDTGPVTVKQTDNVASITPRAKSQAANQASQSQADAQAATQGDRDHGGDIQDAEFTDRNPQSAADSHGVAQRAAATWNVNEGPKKIILAKAGAVGMDEAAVLAKFGTITQDRVNEILRELTKMAAAA